MDSPRFTSPGPYIFKLSSDSRAQISVFINGTNALITAASLQLFDTTGAVISSPTVTIRGNTLTAIVPASALPSTLVLGAGYSLNWTVTLTDSLGTSTHVLRDEVSVHRFNAYASVSHVDVADIDTRIAEIRTPEQIDKVITQIWRRVYVRLATLGRKMSLIIGQSSLHELLLREVLSELNLNAADDVNSIHLTRAAEHKKHAEMLWRSLTLNYDSGDSVVSGSGQIVSTHPVLRLF